MLTLCFTASGKKSFTLLHEAGYNSDWIGKSLAHEQADVRSVYNKAEYREQRQTMLQDLGGYD